MSTPITPVRGPILQSPLPTHPMMSPPAVITAKQEGVPPTVPPTPSSGPPPSLAASQGTPGLAPPMTPSQSPLSFSPEPQSGSLPLMSPPASLVSVERDIGTGPQTLPLQLSALKEEEEEGEEEKREEMNKVTSAAPTSSLQGGSGEEGGYEEAGAGADHPLPPEEFVQQQEEVLEDEVDVFSANVRPSRPSGAPPFSKEEVAAAKRDLEKYYKSMEKDRMAKERHAREEERKRKQIEEALRLEAERKAEIRRLQLLKEAEDREAFIQLARQGRLKAKVLDPPPPPKDPPKWMPLSSASVLIPRGRLHLKINRVIGLGIATGVNPTSVSGTLSGWLGSSTRTLSYEGGGGPEGGGGGKKPAIGNIYVRFELHLGAGVVLSARTHTYPNVVVGDFIPPGCEVEFRLTEGVVLPKADDTLPLTTRLLSPPLLFYSVWQTGKVGRVEDLQMSDGQIPAGALFQPLALYSEHTFPMGPVGEGEKTPLMRAHSGSIKAWLTVESHFQPSSAGILAVSVHEGWALAQHGTGKMDSYPSVSCGVGVNARPTEVNVAGRVPVLEISARGAVCKEGGEYPMFNHEELLLWVDHEHSASQCTFVVSLFAPITGGTAHVGSLSVDVNKWTQDAVSHEERLAIYANKEGNPKGKPQGTILFTHQFYPAGMLTVRVVRGSNIPAADVSGGTDAYVKLSLGGRLTSYKTQTTTLPNSGSEPYWNETFVFDVVDHMDMHVSLWDFDKVTEDDLVGEVMVDLGGVYRYGVRDAALPLKRPNRWGSLEPAGLLLVEADFVGPPGLAYPMLQSKRPAYGDILRENRRQEGAAEEARLRALEEADRLKNEEMKKAEEFMAAAAAAGKGGGEFEDEDIEVAFRTLDFDNDLYISRLELTHALTCMGDLVTRLEVEEMVDMVDADGDHRVAFYEFYQLCKEKEVSNPLWRPNDEERYRKRDWQSEGGIRGMKEGALGVVEGGVVGGKELLAVESAEAAKNRAASEARADEVRRKEDKKKACENAVVELALRLQELNTAYKRFRAHPNYGNPRHREFAEEGHATLEELIAMLPDKADRERPEALAACKALHRAFLEKGTLVCNFYDVLLGLAAFVGCTRPQRINFCFQLYDRDGSGSLDLEELLCILKGSHLAGSTSYLRHKALSIIKSVTAATHKGGGGGGGGAGEKPPNDNDLTIDLEKFVVAANRFPSVLFPSYEARDASGNVIMPKVKSKELKAMEAEEKKWLAVGKKRADDMSYGVDRMARFHIPGMEAPTEGAGGGGGGGGGEGGSEGGGGEGKGASSAITPAGKGATAAAPDSTAASGTFVSIPAATTKTAAITKTAATTARTTTNTGAATRTTTT